MTSSYNGWTASKDPKAIGVAAFNAASHSFPQGVKSGDVAVVLGYVATQYHKRVERLVNPGCWGFNYRMNRNANNLSCHSSATAIDCNAPKHPNGKAGTFNARQVTEIRHILAEVDHVIAWGGDFNHTKDEMHFEIHGNAAEVKKVANKIRGLAKPTTPIAAPADPRLHQGCKGQRVKDIQNALIKHGYHIIADGNFAAGTDRALRAFQKSKRLNPDGITWAGTWAALRKPKS